MTQDFFLSSSSDMSLSKIKFWIPDSFEHKELFEAVTIGVVTLSIFVYGTTLWAYFTFFKKEDEQKSIFK